jgi:hypothetical protein
MKDNTEVVKIVAAMLLQLICLVAGVTFIGLGTNSYVAVGVLCLLIYNNMAKDRE